MFMLAVAAAISAPSPDIAPARPVSATAHATASVRILSGVSIRWGEAADGLPKMRLGQLRNDNSASSNSDASPTSGASVAVQPIRLIEFE